MPKSKEVISSSGSDSESGSEPKQKKKKLEPKPNTKASTSDSKASKGASKKGGKSDDGDESKFEIGKNRFVTVCDFRGKKMVNIREFYQNDDGDMKPGKKGIALTIEQWNKLKDQMEEIDDALDAL